MAVAKYAIAVNFVQQFRLGQYATAVKRNKQIKREATKSVRKLIMYTFIPKMVDQFYNEFGDLINHYLDTRKNLSEKQKELEISKLTNII